MTDDILNEVQIDALLELTAPIPIFPGTGATSCFEVIQQGIKENKKGLFEGKPSIFFLLERA